MKKEIDALDIEILKYLEDDARKSLKKLADDLNKKTSTVYHRLQRLKSKGVILGYSVIFNQEYLDINCISLEKIIVKPLKISSLDTMFIKSFAKFIKTEFPQVLFIGLSESAKTIHLITIHAEEDDHDKFISELKNNPYIEGIESEFLSEIVKGHRIFNFNEEWVKKKKGAEKFGKSNREDAIINPDEEMLEISLEKELKELKF